MKINPQSWEAYQLLHEGTLALAEIERHGIRVDMEYVNAKVIHLTRKMERIDENFKQTDFFRDWQKSTKSRVNINSDKMLGDYLYKHKGIHPPKFTAKSTEDDQKGSTDNEALLELNIPELNALLEGKKLKKLRDYLQNFAREQVDGYIHPFFNLQLVVTYRSSSDHPNFQNMPKRDEEGMKVVRQAIFARPGHQLIEFDFKGAEIRIAACYHKDPTMLRYIEDPSTDMHGDLAKQIFLLDGFDPHIREYSYLRSAAKNGFIFAQFYGDWYKACADNLAHKWGQLPKGKWRSGQGIKLPTGNLSEHLINNGIKSFDAFVEHIKEIEADFWGNRFAKYAQWKEKWWNTYKKNGYIDMMTGFRCSGVMGKNQVINYPVQGASFHCLLWSLIQLNNLAKQENWDSRIVGQIHDSIVMDILPSEFEHIERMLHKIVCEDLPNKWKWICVPMQFDTEKYAIDGSWADKQK